MYTKSKEPPILVLQECCSIAKTVHTCCQPIVEPYSQASRKTMRDLGTPHKHGCSFQPNIVLEDLTCSDNETSANEEEHQSERKGFGLLWGNSGRDKENLKQRWRGNRSALKPASQTVGVAKSKEFVSMPVPSKKRSSSPSPDPPCKKALNYDHPLLTIGSPKNVCVEQRSLQESELSNGCQKSPLVNESLRSLSLNGSQRSPSLNGSQKSPPFNGVHSTPSLSITPNFLNANHQSPQTNGSQGSPISTPSPTPLANKLNVSPSTPLSSSNGEMARKPRPFSALRTRAMNSEPTQASSYRMRKALNIKPSMVRGKGRSMEDRVKSSKLVHDVALPRNPAPNLVQRKVAPITLRDAKVAAAKAGQKSTEASQSPDSTTTNPFLMEEEEIVSGPLATREETVTLCQEQEPDVRLEPHMIGFQNPGNLCWMNSVVQCVISLVPLMGDIQEYMANGIEPGKYSNVLRGLLKILSMRQQGYVTKVNDTLRKFHKSLEALKQEFATDTQQDCPEFLTELLDHLRDEFFRLSRNSAKGAMLREISDNAPDDTASQRENVPNPIRDNTEITMKLEKKCVSCLEVVVGEIREPILIVDVPSLAKCSLQHALKGYFKSADIERQCDSCSARTSTTATSISRLPRVLTVQLKRYICKERTPESTFSGIEKVNSRVRIPEWLSVQDVITDNVQLPSVRVTSMVAPMSVFLDESSNQEDRELEEAKLLSLADDEAEEEQIRQALAASMLDAPRSLPGSINSTPVKDTATTPAKEDESNLSRDYRLVAFIQHMGLNPNSGHYTSTVYNFGPNCWVNYNDADVQRQTFEMATNDRAQKNGYIFFYLHRLQFDALAAAAEYMESG